MKKEVSNNEKNLIVDISGYYLYKDLLLMWSKLIGKSTLSMEICPDEDIEHMLVENYRGNITTHKYYELANSCADKIISLLN